MLLLVTRSKVSTIVTAPMSLLDVVAAAAIGGVAGAGSTLFVDEIRSRRGTRGAARLVESELNANVGQLIRVTLLLSDSTPVPAITFVKTEWIKERDSLARDLPKDSWSLLNLAYQQLDGVEAWTRSVADQPVMEALRHEKLFRPFQIVLAALEDIRRVASRSR